MDGVHGLFFGFVAVPPEGGGAVNAVFVERVKIDVEGAEMHVLKGLIEVLRQNNCKLIIETHSKELEISCMAFLKNEGYNKQKILNNAWWRIFFPETRPIDHNRWLSVEK